MCTPHISTSAQINGRPTTPQICCVPEDTPVRGLPFISAILLTSTVTRWLQKYRLGGLSNLLEINSAPGAARKMSDEVIAALKQELETGIGFSSYCAIVDWLEKEHGLHIEYGTVYAWVRHRLGAKLKVPRPRSYKQDEEVVSGFKKNLVPSY